MTRPAHRPSCPPAIAIALLACLAAGCQPAPSEPEPPPAVRLESPELGVAVAALPAAFQVVSNDAEGLVLEGPGGARLRLTIGPEQRTGINLVEAVKTRRSEIEAAPGGSYLGNRELMTPIGSAFTARGSYERNGARIEETTVFALHPSANRRLTLTYLYPEGEAETRVQELLGVLGEIEGIGFRD